MGMRMGEETFLTRCRRRAEEIERDAEAADVAMKTRLRLLAEALRQMADESEGLLARAAAVSPSTTARPTLH